MIYRGVYLLLLSLFFLGHVKAYNPKEDPDKEVFILSIDGGGMRGVIPAKLLEEMEDRLMKQHGLRTAECFDLITGTSTGGILALGLSLKDPATPRPRYTASELKAFYNPENGAIVFPPKEKRGTVGSLFGTTYPDTGLRALLGRYFGDATLTDLVTDVLITANDTESEQIFLFDSDKAKRNASDNFLLRDVAQATGSAPTYFPPVEVRNVSGTSRSTFIDGGMTCNNPALLGLRRARELYPVARKFVVLSLGTGECPRRSVEAVMAARGKLGWAPLVADLMMNGASLLTHTFLRQDLGGEDYLRLQSSLSVEETEMDTVKPAIIGRWEASARATYGTHQEHLIRLFERIRLDPRVLLRAKGLLSQMKRLQTEKVDLTNCALTLEEATSLQRCFRPEDVQKYYLNQNCLRAVPPLRGFASLLRLDLASNRLQALPESVFSAVPTLTVLHLEDNPGLSLCTGTFAGLGNLKVLYLNHNGMGELPEDVFRSVPVLEELSLQDNKLTTIPRTLFHSLRRLRLLKLENNKLRTLPAEAFRDLASLAQLSLRGNYLEGISEAAFQAFGFEEHYLLLAPQNPIPVEWERREIPRAFLKDSST